MAPDAKVAELVDALDLGSSAARRESSSLSFRTRFVLVTPNSPKTIINFNDASPASRCSFQSDNICWASERVLTVTGSEVAYLSEVLLYSCNC